MYRLSFLSWAVLPAFLLVFSNLSTAQECASKFHSEDFSTSNPCKVFIGVGTSKASEGLKVDYTVDNTPATTYGIQTGDVILTLDGVPVRSQSELLRERDKHQQGEAFSLTILRDGVQKTINARFKACNAAELEAAQENIERAMLEKEVRMEELHALMQEKFKDIERIERPILGVFENTEVNEQGLVIGTVMPGKGAEAAGLQVGDIVVNVDGKTVTGGATLRDALANHKPGDQVTLVYLRDGKSIQTKTVLSADRAYFSQYVDRDPCKVFIGVYTSHALEGRGSRVDGVIDNTPAKISGIQPGDVILAFNGQPVNSHQELTAERDKNKPGDAFRMTVLRDGETLQIDARFKACETSKNAPVEETVVALEENNTSEQRNDLQNIDNSLNLNVFEAYPSPTFGTLNIQFEAEAVPTTVRILDVTGKTVYRKDLPRFDGSFTEQVNLSNNKAGNYVLSIQQGDKVQSKQVVLLPRA